MSGLTLGGLFVASFASPLERAKATVTRALDLGINYIDTAPTYGNSEEVLGACLAGERRPLILSTKGIFTSRHLISAYGRDLSS